MVRFYLCQYVDSCNHVVSNENQMIVRISFFIHNYVLSLNGGMI